MTAALWIACALIIGAVFLEEHIRGARHQLGRIFSSQPGPENSLTSGAGPGSHLLAAGDRGEQKCPAPGRVPPPDARNPERDTTNPTK